MPVARRRGGVAPSSRRAWLLVAAAALVMVAMCVADDSTPATTIGSGSGSGSGSAPPPIHTNDDASPTGSNHWYNLGPALRSVSGAWSLTHNSDRTTTEQRCCWHVFCAHLGRLVCSISWARAMAPSVLACARCVQQPRQRTCLCPQAAPTWASLRQPASTLASRNRCGDEAPLLRQHDATSSRSSTYSDCCCCLYRLLTW